jgi:hypothetical protein
MKSSRKAIITGLALFCFLSMFGIGSVWADERTVGISLSGSGFSTAPQNFFQGLTLSLDLNDISTNGAVSIKGTGFSKDFHAGEETIRGGSFEVTLGERTYQLVETYAISVRTSNDLVNLLIGAVKFEEEKTIERTITVPADKTLTFMIEINSVIRDLRASIGGTTRGKVEINGPVGNSIPITTVFTNAVNAGDRIEISGSFSATLASNTSIVVPLVL